MIKSNWKSFEIDSSENPIPVLLSSWGFLKEALLFTVLSLPIMTIMGLKIAKSLSSDEKNSDS